MTRKTTSRAKGTSRHPTSSRGEFVRVRGKQGQRFKAKGGKGGGLKRSGNVTYVT